MEKYLKGLGLEDKEIELYLACLKNEKNTPASLVKQTGVKRTTVYFYLNKLVKKGLIECLIKKKRRFYQALPAEKALPYFLDQKENQLLVEKKLIEKLVPKIQEISKEKHSDAKMAFYEGKESVNLLIQKLLATKKDLYWYGSNSTIHSVISADKFYRKMTLERMKQNTTAYAITDKESLADPRFKEELGHFRKFKFLDKSINIPAVIAISGNNIFLISANNKDITAVLIEDAIIAKIIFSMFWELWNKIPGELTES